MTRLFTGVAWLFALASIATMITNETSGDPEYYVPVIMALIAAASVLLAWYFRPRRESKRSEGPSLHSGVGPDNQDDDEATQPQQR